MKKSLLFTILLLAVASLSVNAQGIPNFNFEDWTNGTNDAPDGWHGRTINHPGFYPITQSAEHTLGNYSVRIENKVENGDTTKGNLQTIQPGGGEGLGPCFLVNAAYTSLKGFYKYDPLGGDSMQILAPLFKQGYPNPMGYGNILAMGAMNLGAASTFSPFSIPINYFASLTPDSGYISIAASREIDFTTGGHLPWLGNSVLYVDALNYDTFLSINDNQMDFTHNFSLYPTMGSGDINLNFDTEYSDFTTIRIYDLQGRELKSLFAGTLNQGNHVLHYNLSDLQSSEYLLVLATPYGYRSEKLFIK